MFRWKKLGVCFNPQDYPSRPTWMHHFAQGPSTIIFDDFVRVYFSCRPPADSSGQFVSYSAFVDLNKKNLFDIVNMASQPIIKLGELGTFDEFGIYPVSVIQREKELWAYYAGWTRCESVPFNTAIGCAISRNGGETFEKIGNGPILNHSMNEPFILSGPKIRYFDNKWYLFYIAGKKWIKYKSKPEPVYTIRMAISQDGLNWTKLNKELIPPKVEPNEAQASPDVFFFNNKYHMFFCYRHSTDYRGKKGGYRIGYASSEDLLNWTRDDNQAGISISDLGFDSEMVAYPHVFQLEGKWYLMYLGNQVGRYGIGLAELETE